MVLFAPPTFLPDCSHLLIYPTSSSSSLPHSLQFLQSLFLLLPPGSASQDKTQKQTKKKKLVGKYKNRIKDEKKSPYKQNTDSILFGETTPRHGTCPRLWLIYSLTLHWRKLTFIFQSILTNNLLLEGGICVHTPFFVLGFCLVWIFESLENIVTIFKLICAWALLCLEDVVSMETTNMSGSYNFSASLSSLITESCRKYKVS